jgi:hypothetical protein
MIEELKIPPERDPPKVWLAERRAEFVRHVATQSKTPRALGRRHRRRSVAIAFAAVALAGAFAATPAFGIRHGVLHLLGFAQPTPAEAARTIEGDWRDSVFARAHEAPEEHFDNLARDVLVSRVQSAASQYHFDVRQVMFLRPAQDAPLVVVRTDNPQQLAEAAPAILRLIDPKQPTGDDRTGWAFEGFYFEAQDADGTPFLIVFNYWRGADAGGGQWARSPDLFPFRHGGRPPSAR